MQMNPCWIFSTAEPSGEGSSIVPFLSRASNISLKVFSPSRAALIKSLFMKNFHRLTLLTLGKQNSDVPQNFKKFPPEAFLLSNETALSDEELIAIPGAVDILDQYATFHNELQTLIDSEQIDKSPHGQALGFGSYKQQERVWNFMKLFANEGNVLPTLQAALHYYYANRMYGQDRQTVEKMIDNIKPEVAQQHDFDDDWKK